MLLRMIVEIKCLATGLDASLSYFFMSRGCSRNLSPSRLPVSPMYNFFAKGASYIVNDIGRFARELISNLNESPRSSPLRYEWKDRFCIARERSWKIQKKNSRHYIFCSFSDLDIYGVMSLTFPSNQRQSALQTTQKENTDLILYSLSRFTLTNTQLKSIIR